MPGTITFLSRVSSEFGHLDEVLRSQLAPLPSAVIKTPTDLEGYDAGLTTLDKLWDFIKNADAVIHVVGVELGSKPPQSMIDELLARHAELKAWLSQKSLASAGWTYTQWEVFLALFRRHQCGGGRPLIFVATQEVSDPPDPRPPGSEREMPASPSLRHLDTLVGLDVNANIRFRIDAELLTNLMTKSEFGALVHSESQAAVISLAELETAFQGSVPAHELLLSLQWTTSGKRGPWLERPELDRVLDAVVTESHGVSLVLGVPGSGKSALLARIAELCTEHDVLVVSIKADGLSEEVCDERSLARELGLPAGTDLVTSVRRVAVDRKVVVLVDQLDALAGMVVQKPARLRLLMQLIHHLSATENVHIVASCRTFEQRHEPWLRTIEAREVELALPQWNQVRDVLVLYGVDASRWNSEIRETLRNPQALTTFVGLLGESADLPLITSYHQMLDRLWKLRVLNDPTGHRSRVARRVADTLADRESLWIPVALFDGDRAAIDQLIAGDILRIEGARLGFRHQTLFEHARARSLACEPNVLLDTVRKQQKQLRVRPQVWHGLSYLRDVDREAYHQTLKALWEFPELRAHIRMLLIDFMGTQAEPTGIETGLMFAALDDPAWLNRVVKAMTGSPGWFARLRTDRLKSLMAREQARPWSVLNLLVAAYQVDQQAALELIRRNWIPRPDMSWLAWNALERVPMWTEAVVSDLISLISIADIGARNVDHVCVKISSALPEQAPRLLGAWLARQDELEQSERFAQSNSKQGDASPTHGVSRRSSALTRSELYSAGKIASAAPIAFVEEIWPWFVRAASAIAYGVGSVMNVYRPCAIDIDFGDERIGEYGLVHALDAALCAWAIRAPAAFLALVGRHSDTDAMLVQQLLARGMAQIAQCEPQAALEFLLSDPRRMALGARDRCAETWALVEALVPHLDAAQRSMLEEEAIRWSPYRADLEEDAATQASRERWRREDRLLLLRCFPAEFRSAELARLIAHEEAEFPNVKPAESVRTLEEIVSPISAAQMADASDGALLAALKELPDSTASSHPYHPMLGGAEQIAREFRKFAELRPQRAMDLVRGLPPSQHAIAAGYAINGVVTSVPASDVFAFAEEILQLGYDGDGLRRDVATALGRVVALDAPVPEPLLEILGTWLGDDCSGSQLSNEVEPSDFDSQLWRDGGWRAGSETLNLVALSTLAKSFRLCDPPRWSRWLEVFEAHVVRVEQPHVWTFLVAELQYLREADRQRASEFIGKLLTRHPEICHSREIAWLLRSCLSWAAEDDALTWFALLARSARPRASQSAGELALLRHLKSPDDIRNRQYVEGALRVSSEPDENEQAQRIGLAHTAAALWRWPSTRLPANEYLLSLLRAEDSRIEAALSAIFRVRFEDEFPADACTKELLEALIANSAILKQPPAEHLVEHLDRLLGMGWEPELVGRGAIALVDQAGDTLSDVATAWPFSAARLTDVVLRLQEGESVEVRALGADLMEKLLEYNLPAAGELITDLDMRLDDGSGSRLPRRRSRVRAR
jgi:hypothetical protein